MSKQSDIARIVEQERSLVLSHFDEAVAFSIGSAIRERALAEGLSIVVSVQTWDRPVFYAALAGTSGDNPEWVRRKANVVKRFGRSSYRLVLERSFEERIFPADRAIDPNDHVLAGGGFPITVTGAGVIGAIIVSGLPERQDHEVVVAALCDHLGLSRAQFALAPQADD